MKFYVPVYLRDGKFLAYVRPMIAHIAIAERNKIISWIVEELSQISKKLSISFSGENLYLMYERDSDFCLWNKNETIAFEPSIKYQDGCEIINSQPFANLNIPSVFDLENTAIPALFFEKN